MGGKLSRRSFLKVSVGTVMGGALMSGGQAVAKPIFYSQPAPLLPASHGRRVVVAGGGWGGVTAARLLKQRAPEAEVVLIEQRPTFMSCPISNLFLAGMVPLEFISFDYLNVVKDGVIFVNERITDIDRDARIVATTAGTVNYDYLVLSPGIDYLYEAIEGYEEVKHLMPIGFKPFEHIPLRRLIDAFDGGELLIAIPEPPYRCPPGPYERAALLAWRLKEDGIPGKVIVLDANSSPLSKAAGFTAAYTELYSDYLEYYPNTQVTAIDYANKRLETTFGDFDYALANIIPPMKASPLVAAAGLGDRWANIRAPFFMSEADDRVYVIGDIIGGQPFPKSGQMAQSMGGVVAGHIAERLAGKELDEIEASLPTNICYSFVNQSEAIWVAHNFAWNAAEGRIIATASTDETRSEVNGELTFEWARGVWSLMFGEHS
jgi:NADH dehydrogenase FAD-containing subunit